MTIDIGAPADGRGSSWALGYTIISLDNPANENGNIDEIQVYAASNIEGFVVAVFDFSFGEFYKTRSRVVIGNVTAGSQQPFTGLTLACLIGDYIGCYYSAGTIERDTDGGLGILYRLEDQTTVDNETSYATVAGDLFSLFGFSVVAGWTHKFIGVSNASIGKINGVAIADILKVNSVE